ncbi:FBD-associated F-box protein [Rosa sericea]
MQMGSKSNSKPGQDRISGLPDEILCHILSFTSTVDAVKASLLSHRWENMWLSVPTLYLCDDDFCSDEREFDPERFVAFVDRALFLRGSSSIHRISIRCSDTENYPHLDEWICTAIRGSVVELELDLHESDVRYEPFELPRSLFMSRSLVVLKLTLEQNYVAIPPSSDCFPCLKLLDVSVFYPDPATMERLFTCGPVLEHLIIEGYLGEEQYLNFNIFAPKLKRLELRFDPFDEVDYVSNILFNVNAPKLERLDLNENFLASYCLSENALSEANISFSDLHSEDIQFITGSVDHVQRLFEGILNVKHLSLQAPFLGDPDTESRCNLPKLNNLKHLELQLENCCSWQILTRLLTISPNLEYLVLEINIQCCEYPNEDGWSPPKLVPICLVSCLKNLFIRGFKGKPDDIEVTKYLMKHGEVLNNVTIYSCDVPAEYMLKVCQEISLFPKGSNTCQVEFPKIDM